jgi:hypothetical protein
MVGTDPVVECLESHIGLRQVRYAQATTGHTV